MRNLILTASLTAIWLGAPVALRADDVAAVVAEIDALADEHWQREQIAPAAASEDAEFLRRLTLDLWGRIPTADEAQAFAADKRADKRERAIDRLLAGPEYSLHMGRVLDAMLQGKYAGDEEFVAYLRRGVRNGRPWDRTFRELMLGPWDADEAQAAKTFLLKRIKNLDELTNDATRVFFGVNVSCAKCHDHPLVDDWKQRHFYGMQSFFNRSYEDKKHNTVGEKEAGEVQFVDVEGQRHTADIMFLSGAVVTPENTPLDPHLQERREELKQQKKPAFSPRNELVRLALEDQQFFSRAIANQLWAYFTGRGLVHPVDQLHSANPPSVPGLLDCLAEDLASHGYDLNRTVRAIVRSRVYGLSSRWTSGSEPPHEMHFARAKLRPLAPRQFAMSLLLAAGEQSSSEMSAEARDEHHRELESQAAKLTALLDEPRDEFRSSVVEALYMSNNADVQQLTAPAGKNLAARLLRINDPAGRVDAAFWAILSRAPKPDERAELAAWLESQESREQACRDLVWALMTSAGFRFNH